MNESQREDHPNINKNVHPPIVALLYIALAFLLGFFVRVPLAIPAWAKTAGFALIIIGFILAFGAFNEFHKAHTTLDPHGSVKALVTNGIYRFTRNPIYLGFLLLIIGMPLNSGYLSGVVVAPFFMSTLNRLVIEKEEAYLEEKFKEQYTGYKSRVRRWL